MQVTVRDADWGTMRPTVRRADVREDADGFTVDLDAVHGDDAFTWRGTIRGSADGSLDFEMEGVAERDLLYRRIGICVLHPWEAYVGARFAATGSSRGTSGTFPQEMVPQPLVGGEYRAMIPAFEHLEVAFPGGTVANFAFEGELEGWELEDQRNWTDASFKTYPTPLGLSHPRTLYRGERVRQRLRWQLAGPAPQDGNEDGPVILRLGDPKGRVMPSLGITAPQDAGVDPDRLASLGAAHMRVVLDVAGDLEDLRTAASTAGNAGLPLEVSFLLEDDEDGSRLRPAVEVLEGAPIARILVLRRSGATADGAFVTRIRPHLHRLGPRPIAGGTAAHFSELNRAAPDPATIDAVALAMSPQVHEVDERSMLQTLAIQEQIAERVRALVADRDVIVSPVTLAVHDPSNPDDEIDERVGSAFGTAWTVGSACALASGGAAAVTLHERADRTVLASAALSRAFRLLAARTGRELDSVGCSHPARVCALAAAGLPVLVANLTSEPVEIRLVGEVNVGGELAPYEVAELERSPR